ncbi:SsgA family sporulation/cell division regulator [Streptomyces sp. x-80]|uniref:SsgA family sporulation/cell division regulator n=1 Tax=Streptomyces sp. x-80 TaxID=2789282 RepID=UPI003980F91D
MLRLLSSSEMVLSLPDEPAIWVTGELEYRSDRPYEVCLDICFLERTYSTWRFSRDLLFEGIKRSTGTGDVRVSPGCGRYRAPGREIDIELHGAHGKQCLLTANATVLRMWCEQVLNCVPQGTEEEHLDIGKEIAALMT